MSTYPGPPSDASNGYAHCLYCPCPVEHASGEPGVGFCHHHWVHGRDLPCPECHQAEHE